MLRSAPHTLHTRTTHAPLTLLAPLRQDQLHLRCATPEKIGPIAVSHDGIFCVGGGASGRLYVWEIGTGELLRVLDGHYKSVAAIAFTDDDSFVISGGADAIAQAWSMGDLVDEDKRGSTSCAPFHSWTGHSLPVTSVFCGMGGINSRVVTSSLDHSVKIWALYSGLLLHSVAFPSFINDVLMDSAECLLFAAGGDGDIYVTDLRLVSESSAIAAAGARTAGGAKKAGAGRRGARKGASTSRGAASSPSSSSSSSSSLSSSSSSSSSGEVERSETSRGALVGHSTSVTCLDITPDGGCLLSGAEGGGIIVWDVRSRQAVRRVGCHNDMPVTAVKFAPRPTSFFRDHTGDKVKALPLAPIAPFKKFRSDNGAEVNKSEFMTRGRRFTPLRDACRAFDRGHLRVQGDGLGGVSGGGVGSGDGGEGGSSSSSSSASASGGGTGGGATVSSLQKQLAEALGEMEQLKRKNKEWEEVSNQTYALLEEKMADEVAVGRGGGAGD